MSRVGRRVVALLLALAGSGCAQERTGPGDLSSSGSNWLRCEEFSDCSAASQAVACRADGFCTDARGERIALSSVEGGGQEPGQSGDAGDAQLPVESPSLADAMLPPLSLGQSDANAPGSCPWGVDGALREAGVVAPDRRNCGFYSWPASALPAGVGCVDGAVAEQAAVQISFQRCFDCWARATYVVTEAGERFEITLEAGPWTENGRRNVSVQSCTALDTHPSLGLTCAGPEPRYSCSERPGPRELEPDPPVEPYKLKDPPTSAGAAPTTLHLYVSNQSFAEPLVDIKVSIAETLVLFGDFAIEGQHNWYAFDIQVPQGTLRFDALSYSVEVPPAIPSDLLATGTEGAVSLQQEIAVPAERWAVLDYWYDPSDSEGRHFTLTMSDVPVSFE